MSRHHHTILLISKPVAPPWNDSSKNLVKDLALAGQRYQYRILTRRGHDLEGPGICSEPIYSGAGGFSPALSQNARVFARLLRPDDTALAHFFFAPNLRSSRAARLALALRGRRTIQTICSVPEQFHEAGPLLFAERVIVLSRHTRDRFLEAGISPHRLALIPPGIRIPPAPGDEHRSQTRRLWGLPSGAPVLVYPGDLQFSRAARTVVRAGALLRDLDPVLVLACRPKQQQSLLEERRVRALAARLGISSRVRFLGEVPDMPALLGACDLCLLPAESLFAKMDYPLVLLEAMALGIPLVLARCGPLAELMEDGVGLGVPPLDPEALAAAARSLLERPAERERLRTAARQVACQKYDIAAVSRQYEVLYDEVLAS